VRLALPVHAIEVAASGETAPLSAAAR
jgi:hypothetical protein